MNFDDIEDGIVELIRKAETELPKDVIDSLKKAYDTEEGVAKTQIEAILTNIDLAKKSKRPMCQDTGIQTFFVTTVHSLIPQFRIWDIIMESGANSKSDGFIGSHDPPHHSRFF